jgi:ATP-dependent DNA helicase RecG
MKVQRLITEGESEVLEFKATFGKDVIETLCAFANHRGGTVLIGVADDGKIIGASCGEESMQIWVNEIKQNTTPSIIPDIEMAPINGKNVVIVRVSEFPIKPVAYRDRYFKRVANSNHRLSLTEIANLHLQSLQLSWDSYPEERATVNDISLGKMEAFLRRVKEGGRHEVYPLSYQGCVRDHGGNPASGDFRVSARRFAGIAAQCRGSPGLHQPDRYSDQDI